MRTLLVSAAVAAAALTAVPATAQWHGGQHGWHQRGPDRRAVAQLVRQIDRVEERIHRSARRGRISPREAFGLRREAVHLRDRLHRASRNGLSGREYGELRHRVNRLEQQLRYERRDRDRRRG